MTQRFLSLSNISDHQRSRLLSNALRAGFFASIGLLPLHSTLADSTEADLSRGSATISITKVEKVLLEPQFDALVQVESSKASNSRVDLCFGHAPGSAAYEVTVYSVDTTPPAPGQTRGFAEYKTAEASGPADSNCEAASPWGMSVPVPSSDVNESDVDTSGNAGTADDLSLMLLVSPE